MRPGDAVQLTNFFPTVSNIVLRKGIANFTTGLGSAQVETLASYAPTSGVDSLWAWAGSSLYNSTTKGAMPAAAVSGLTNARWQHINYTTSGGNFLIAVNGVDDMLLYTGSAWQHINASSTPTAITGVLTSALTNITVHQNRVWYVENNSFNIWYSGAGAFAGALTKLDLSPNFSKGGFLVAMGTWTLDGGNGPDDLALFISSKGEVCVYQGIDPASTTTWAKVGTYKVGEPIGRRCFQQFKGDLVILTSDGLIPASKGLVDNQTEKSTAISDRITGAMSDAAQSYGNNFGWETTHFSNGSMLIVNVPISVGTQAQYVMNTDTGAWCDFEGLAANCFCVHNKSLYFGTKGGVTQAWTGTSDNSKVIQGELIGAFDYFRDRDGQKLVTLFRPVIGWDANPASFLVGVDVDFKYSRPSGAIAFPTSQGGIWDTSKWDQAIWGGDVKLNTNWYTVFGEGFALAPHLIITSAQANITIAAFDYSYVTGAVL